MIINTKDPKVVIRPATALDIEALYGEPTGETLRAWVMDVDDVPSAIGGVSLAAGEPPLIFSRLTDRVRPHKLAILKGAKALLRYLSQFRYPMFAVADPAEPGSSKLLTYLGLQLVNSRNGYFVYMRNPARKEG